LIFHIGRSPSLASLEKTRRKRRHVSSALAPGHFSSDFLPGDLRQVEAGRFLSVFNGFGWRRMLDT
jgi:hypothetical protein